MTGLSPEIQVLVAIGFFAHGSYQRPAGNQCELVVSQSTASRCIRKVAQLINTHLLRQWIKFPMTVQEKTTVQNKFSLAAQPFPGAIGAIDCTYINILTPHIHEEAYVNHHGNHSLNVQAIVDPDIKILNINARYPDARNDAYIWMTSPIRRVMEHWYNQGERKMYLIGDAGYPLEPWLVTPLAHYPRHTRQYHYNEKLCKARSIVERFFGILKGTWRCLSYQRTLMYTPEISGQIVNSYAVLHNMRVHYRLPLEIEENIIFNNAHVNQANDIDEEEQDIILRRGPRAIAQRIQKRIMRDWFPNYQCAWNNEEI